MDGLLLLCVTGAVKYEARLEVQHVKISKLVVFCVSSAQGHNISRSGRLHIYPSTQPKAKGNFTHVMATLQMARQQLNDAIKALVLNAMQLYNHLCTWVMLTDAKSAFMFSRLVDNIIGTHTLMSVHAIQSFNIEHLINYFPKIVIM